MNSLDTEIGEEKIETRLLMRWQLPEMPISIRVLQESDVRHLEWQGGADLRSFYEWQWLQHQIGEREVLVADFNGFPIAQVALHWGGKIAHPGIPDIQSLRVMPAFRGLNIGTQLIQACENEVREQNGQRIGLAVALNNGAASRLYERLGYAADGEPYDDKWDYLDARGQKINVVERVIDMLKTLS